MRTQHRVIVVGAGYSGIAMAVRLRAMGVEEFVVLERANDLGGTWRDNTYPGAACDVPANVYSYSFAPNPEWSRTFATQGEIWDYLRGCVDRFDVGDALLYGRAVEEACWDATEHEWAVRVRGGEEHRAPVLVWAGGLLSEPWSPELTGIEAFRGKVFHSAAWEHGFGLRGKRVCVVGTGASAVQFVPRIAAEVEHLVVHQRSAPWVLPRRDRAVSRPRQATYARFPGLQRVSRRRTSAVLESAQPVFTGGGARHARRAQEAGPRTSGPASARRGPAGRSHATRRVRLHPVLLSDDYYPTLTRPNVELVASPAVACGQREVVGADGIARPADVVVMATGFAAARPAWASRLVGLGGVRLSEAWERDGISAYAGTTVGGFPNLFLVLGPNSGLAHTSVVPVIEAQVDYIAAALRFLGRRGVREVELRAAVQRRFAARVRERSARTVWERGGSASWYLDGGLNTTLWPGRTGSLRRLLRRFHPGDYVVRA